MDLLSPEYEDWYLAEYGIPAPGSNYSCSEHSRTLSSVDDGNDEDGDEDFEYRDGDEPPYVRTVAGLKPRLFYKMPLQDAANVVIFVERLAT